MIDDHTIRLMAISDIPTEAGKVAREELYKLGFVPYCQIVRDVTQLVCRDGEIVTTSGYNQWTWRPKEW